MPRAAGRCAAGHAFFTRPRCLRTQRYSPYCGGFRRPLDHGLRQLVGRLRFATNNFTLYKNNSLTQLCWKADSTPRNRYRTAAWTDRWQRPETRIGAVVEQAECDPARGGGFEPPSSKSTGCLPRSIGNGIAILRLTGLGHPRTTLDSRYPLSCKICFGKRRDRPARFD